MIRYILRRLLWVVFLLFAVSFVTFVIFYLLPSADPAVLRAGRQANPELVASIRHQLGLDQPWYVQYGRYMKNLIFHFDFGFSYQNGVPVRQLIFSRLPASISLAAGAAVLWLVIGIGVGIIAAVRPRTKLDRASMGAALVGISAPVYWLGLVALYLFSSDIGLIPILPGANSYVPLSEDPFSWFTSLIMPWCVLAVSFAAFYSRLLRGNLTEVLGEDYIRTRQRTLRAARRLSPRLALCDHTDRDYLRARSWDPARRRDPDRDRFQHPGHRPTVVLVDRSQRPASDSGHRSAWSLLHRLRQPLR